MSDKIEGIISKLDDKAELKQKVYERTLETFRLMKNCAVRIRDEISPRVLESSPHVEIALTDQGDFEFHLRFSGDTIVFMMHTNVFTFPPNHKIAKTYYVNQHPQNGFFGMIQIYNFLSDSLKYQRLNDAGYLLARVFVNVNDHFYTEGKRQLGFLYNEVGQQVVNEDDMQKIIEQCMLFCLDFDLYVPPEDALKVITVEQKNYFNNPRGIGTGKRLGFQVE
ncbi:MAG: hypothetical protein H6606_01145 [Flavobacteriales bacterium]|nr:hypothetical protein [Flavobacteriales bacterium]